jgi:hypothetical protein
MKQNNPPKITNSLAATDVFYEYRSLIYSISGRIYINLFTKSGSKCFPFFFCNNSTASTKVLAFFIRANGNQSIERITHSNDSSFNKDFLSFKSIWIPGNIMFFIVLIDQGNGGVSRRGNFNTKYLLEIKSFHSKVYSKLGSRKITGYR